MKHILLLAMTLFLAMQGVNAVAEQPYNNCRKKEQALLRELEYARQRNNQNRIRGLERALANVRAWCSEDGLLTKAESKVIEKRENVREREEELAEARAEGKKASKIAKRQRKLDEAKNELQEALQERDALLDSVNPEE